MLLSVTGIVTASILFSGLALPYEAFAETRFKGFAPISDDCLKCPSNEVDKKSDPDRKGHKVKKKSPVKKEPPKKEPPKKEPPKKEPPKKILPKKVKQVKKK